MDPQWKGVDYLVEKKIITPSFKLKGHEDLQSLNTARAIFQIIQTINTPLFRAEPHLKLKMLLSEAQVEHTTLIDITKTTAYHVIKANRQILTQD